MDHTTDPHCQLCAPPAPPPPVPIPDHGAADASAAPPTTAGGLDWLGDLLSTAGFPARWNCGDWPPTLGYTHIISDTLIFLAYMAIPALLAYFFYVRRRDVLFPKVAWLFVAFIAACGTGHLIEAIIFYQPVYHLAGVSKLITAAVSCATVVALIPAIPKAMDLPGLALMNERLEAEVGVRQRAEEAVRQRNEDLQTLLHILSHDLKEPVRAISGFSRTLEKNWAPQLDPKGQDYFARLVRASQRMEKQLDDLLQISRIGRLNPDASMVSLKSVVDQAVDRLESRLGSGGAQLSVSDTLPVVRGDELWLVAAVENLLSNALKYHLPGERPVIEVLPYHREPSDGEARAWCGLIVADRGIGVEEAARERIFELFRREVGREVPGSGAGLSIVANVAQRHGGRAWVEPREGGGSRFIIALPTPGVAPPRS